MKADYVDHVAAGFGEGPIPLEAEQQLAELPEV